MIEWYRKLKEEPLALLDEASEFKEKYICGFADSEGDEEDFPVWKSDIKGQIIHLKDKAKASGISIRGNHQLAKELWSLKIARTKIQAKLSQLQDRAEEACIKLRKEDL